MKSYRKGAVLLILSSKLRAIKVALNHFVILYLFGLIFKDETLKFIKAKKGINNAPTAR